MERKYWENLEPFVRDEVPPEATQFEGLRAVFLAVQNTLAAARALADQVAEQQHQLGAANQSAQA